jgi:RNA polymerase sigma-70 factor (ECF subfamily)
MSVPIARAETGSFDAAFPALFNKAYKVAFRILGDRGEAEEAAQEAVARAYERWDKLAPGGVPLGWVARVSANLAIDTWRRRGRLGGVTSEQAREDPSAADRVALVRVLQDLPRRQREVVVLRFLADLPEAEVAACLGIGTGSVKQHSSRGLAHLRAALGEEGR